MQSCCRLNHDEIPTNIKGQATELWLCQCKSIQIRTFHITWFTFFICFFGWFATANLYTFIANDIGLTTVDKGIGGGCSVASTVIFRIIVGKYCDSFGARKMYVLLLITSSIAVSCTALVRNNIEYIIVHFFIGITGAGFVITSYHTTKMFAGRVVGTANAISGGWGNVGGGCANALMPLLMLTIGDYFNLSNNVAWRITMIIPAIVMLILAVFYYFFTVDQVPEPQDNSSVVDNTCKPSTSCDDLESEKQSIKQSTSVLQKTKQIKPDSANNSENNHNSLFWQACKDSRTWILFFVYGGTFGMEITFLRFGSSYLEDVLNISTTEAGFVVFGFSIMNIIARPIGGIIGDYLSETKLGLKGRVYPSCILMIIESILLVGFAFVEFDIVYTIIVVILFSFFVQAAGGVTFALVPVLQPNAVGSVAGIVSAGGNFVALIFAFALFTCVPDKISYKNAWIICAIYVFACGLFVTRIKFTKQEDEIYSRHSTDRNRDSNTLAMKSISSISSIDSPSTVNIENVNINHADTTDHDSCHESTKLKE